MTDLEKLKERVREAREALELADAGTKNGTVCVTEHGLRRLLRLAAKVFPLVHQLRLYTCGKEVPPHMFGLYAGECTPEILAEMGNESSTIWCEGTLVMSRLFVEDGKVYAHPDEEVDAAGIPPWEKSESTP